MRDLAEAEGFKLEVLELDVTDDVSVKRAIEAVIASAGNIDVVVNNAGVMANGFLETFTLEQAQMQFDVNTFGPMRVNRAAVPHMRRARTGVLIHVTSVVARLQFPFLNVYGASKSALESLVEAYRYELAPFGVDSVAVEPGGFPTEIGENAMHATDADVLEEYGDWANQEDKVFGKLIGDLSVPGAADPQEVADTILTLADTPFGKRPLRSVVGTVATQGVEEFNAHAAKLQEAYYRIFSP